MADSDYSNESYTSESESGSDGDDRPTTALEALGLLTRMRQLPSDAGVQRECCKLLANCTEDDWESQRDIGQAGFIPLVLKALRHPEAQEYAASTLYDLCEFQGNHLQLVHDGAIPVLVKTTQQSQKDKDVLLRIAGSLRLLARNANNFAALVQAGVVSASLKAMHQYPKDEEVQEHFCRLLGSLALDATHRVNIRQSGAAEMVSKAARRFLQNDNLQWAHRIFELGRFGHYSCAKCGWDSCGDCGASTCGKCHRPLTTKNPSHPPQKWSLEDFPYSYGCDICHKLIIPEMVPAFAVCFAPKGYRCNVLAATLQPQGREPQLTITFRAHAGARAKNGPVQDPRRSKLRLIDTNLASGGRPTSVSCTAVTLMATSDTEVAGDLTYTLTPAQAASKRQPWFEYGEEGYTSVPLALSVASLRKAPLSGTAGQAPAPASTVDAASLSTAPTHRARAQSTPGPVSPGGKGCPGLPKGASAPQLSRTAGPAETGPLDNHYFKRLVVPTLGAPQRPSLTDTLHFVCAVRGCETPARPACVGEKLKRSGVCLPCSQRILAGQRWGLKYPICPREEVPERLKTLLRDHPPAQPTLSPSAPKPTPKPVRPNAFQRRVLDMATDDTRARMPIQSLFKTCSAVLPIEQALQPVAATIADCDLMLKAARRKAREALREFPDTYAAMGENLCAYIVAYTAEAAEHERSLYYLLNKALRELRRDHIKRPETRTAVPPCQPLPRRQEVPGDLRQGLHRGGEGGVAGVQLMLQQYQGPGRVHGRRRGAHHVPLGDAQRDGALCEGPVHVSRRGRDPAAPQHDVQGAGDHERGRRSDHRAAPGAGNGGRDLGALTVGLRHYGACLTGLHLVGGCTWCCAYVSC